jgi:hypothetical protein
MPENYSMAIDKDTGKQASPVRMALARRAPPVTLITGVTGTNEAPYYSRLFDVLWCRRDLSAERQASPVLLILSRHQKLEFMGKFSKKLEARKKSH